MLAIVLVLAAETAVALGFALKAESANAVALRDAIRLVLILVHSSQQSEAEIALVEVPLDHT